jgi:hypothetical protein
VSASPAKEEGRKMLTVVDIVVNENPAEEVFREPEIRPTASSVASTAIGFASLRRVKSLQDICAAQLSKYVVGKIQTLEVLALANELMLKELRADCIRAIRFKYEFFKEATEDGYLLELCGEDEIEEMEKALRDKDKFKRVAKQEGTILKRRDTEFSEADARAYDDTGSKIFYPREALVGGVKWPVGIDPGRREEWLSDAEFEKIFGMDRKSFRELGAFKRERLKRDNNLW